ncbi:MULTISPECIES: phage tail assembly chaperone [Pseudomonas]|uniref:Phage tail assembly chaperone n=1 Tax=Pseudomonas wuhanensis TaxID=2954098 RepID=A0ABY9GNN8_9PSED|nr:MULTISPECIES: phage tail assembly chaperone [unclassified Pseudomonas]WLI11541.1 phage tail assembly chaperone [Pseudomonas sp. FP603]WLI17382.1 phage tail assembly chaperone [Pseudomonas sp. FP607]
MNEFNFLFSASTCGVYVPGINTSDIPSDVIEIPQTYWVSLLQELAVTAKMISVRADNGYPVLVDTPPLSPEEAANAERFWRDAQLSATDSIVARDRDELEDGGGTTLTADQYAQLQAYRRALRDWPQGSFFPFTEHRPSAPLWLAEQL